jgi:prolyl oligopeptidase
MNTTVFRSALWAASAFAVVCAVCTPNTLIAQQKSKQQSQQKQSKQAPNNAPAMTTSNTAIAPTAPSTPPLQYPKTRKVDHADVYHGTTVADPYRWLEDDTSKETEAWVAEQNKLTFGFLDKIPFRQQVLSRLENIYNYPKYSAPTRKGTYTFFSKNDGLQNQSVLYVQEDGKSAPEVFFDPNTLSTDGTVKLAQSALSNVKPGKPLYWAYGLSQGGSDWSELYVMTVKDKKKLTDHIKWVKVSGIAWQGDGFYYSRYPAPSNEKSLASKNENHQVWYHTIGTEQSADKLVYEDPKNPQRFHLASVTDDERFVILYISDRGKGKDGNALYVLDNAKKETSFKPVVTGFDDDFTVIDNVDDKLLVQTNKNAPNKKVVLIDPANPAEQYWKTVIAEKPEPLEFVSSVGGKLFAGYLKDATSRVFVHNLTGAFEHELQLPVLGTVGGFGGEKADKSLFYVVTSFTFPPTIYEYTIATKESKLFRKSDVLFTPDDYETKQVFYTSKDGTKVPMFIVHKKGVQLSGTNPTLLYGYGGFNINLTPTFSPTLIGWLEQGGVYALANLRGGGEYGEQWHEQGMKLKKQNVFDDFIAAAEYLIKEKYTSSERLAIKGGSNGGLLVGACMIQRPELFKVALPAVGVMDMLRFHKFTIGWNWIADYGSSDNAEEFKALYAYSPLHTLKDGVHYPATLVTTADHDDRVVPAHSFKFAATLQEKHKGANPVLIRIDTKSGHGASNTKKALQTTADEFSFAWYVMGFTPKY